MNEENEKQERILKIGPLLSGEKEALSFDRVFPGDWEVNGLSFREIRFSGTVSAPAGILRLNGTAACDLTSLCARCLAPVSARHTARAEGVVSTEEGEEDDQDRFLADGEDLDLLEVAESALLPGLPFRLLCREDCRGLCPVCGKDLNEGDCACPKQAPDPRLAGLADFFKEE